MEWLVEGVSCWPVGSRVTCDPAPTDTDIDYLVYDRQGTQVTRLQELNFSRCEDEEYDDVSIDSSFKAFRKGEVNVIISSSKYFVDRFLLATAVAKKLNLLDKQDRITLFAAIKYEECDEYIEEIQNESGSSGHRIRQLTPIRGVVQRLQTNW